MKTEHDTNMCLDYWSKPKGDVLGTIMMYACHNSHNQQWSFRTGSTTGAGVPQGELISQAARNGCMTYHNENTNGNVDVTACNGAQNQIWHLNPEGTLRTAVDGTCLTAGLP